MATTVATLPEDARGSFKEPLGPLFTEAEALLADAGRPIVAVGDVVTYHLVESGTVPHLAVIDGKTEREAVSEAVEAGVPADAREVRVGNPAAAITAELVEAMAAALDREDPTVLRVEGEEDLATLPAVLLAPEGASVVYGQPGEGMVRVDVDADVQARVRALCGSLETDETFWDLVA